MFYRGKFAGSRMFDASRITTVGSAPGAAVVLKDEAIQERHAVLHVEGDQVHISAHPGVQLSINGQLCVEAVIGGADDIVLGPFRLKVELVNSSGVPEPSRVAPPRVRAPSVRGTPAPARSRTPVSPPPPPPAGSDATPTPGVVTTAPEVSVAGSGNATRPLAEASSSKSDARPVPPPGAARPPPDLSSPSRAAKAAPEPRDLQSKLQSPAAVGSKRDRPVDDPTLKVRIVPEGADDQAVLASITEGLDAFSETAETRSESARPVGVTATPAPVVQAVAEDYPRLPQPVPDGEIDAASTVQDAYLDAFSATPRPVPQIDLDDEELEELHFQPSFSLLDNILRDRGDLPEEVQDISVAEMIVYREDRILDVVRVDRGGEFRAFDADRGGLVKLFSLSPAGRGRLHFDDTTEGSLVLAGQTHPLSSLCTTDNAGKTKATYAKDMAEGDYGHLQISGCGYLVRFVRAPQPPPDRFEVSVTRDSRTYVGLASLAIVLLLAVIWIEALVAPRQLLAMEEEVEFAEVTVKELQLEPPDEPPPPPPPEPEPEPPAPEKVEVPPEPAAPPRSQRKNRRRRRRRRGAPTAAQKQAADALDALSNIVPSRSDRRLSTTVSNIARTRVPSGARKRFRVAGPTGKLPGNDVVLSTTNGGGRETRSASRLLQGSDVGRVGSAGRRGRVRGVVRNVSRRRIKRTGGRLSKAEIAKVVARGIPAVQRCYEREVIKNPRLQGKIVFDWVIAVSGKVSSTRVRSSSLKSRRVAQCISREIKTWSFPRPVGGSVKVTFPFVFRVQGF